MNKLLEISLIEYIIIVSKIKYVKNKKIKLDQNKE